MLSPRALATKIVNLCVRAVVTRSGEQYQAQWLGDRITPPVENFQPQGLHFRVPVGAEHLLLSPCGETSAAVMVGAHKRSAMPKDKIGEGEGGLHYLGTFAVFVGKDGTVHLGGGIGASDYVALAKKVDAALTTIQSTFDAHTHPAPGGATSATLTLIKPLESTAASKVKAT
jgi:hypothetical protein